MKKRNYAKKLCSIFLIFMMAAGLIPAASYTALANNEETGYKSVYPERITDSIVSDDFEAYKPGTATVSLYSKGYTWFPNGNNQNEFAFITETENGNVVQIENTKGYPTFSTPSLTDYSGKLWVDVDLKIPGGASDFRMQFGNKVTDRAQLRFAKGNIQALTQNPAGAVSTITYEGAEITDEWFTLSMWFDMENERQRIYINGEQLGYEMNLNHKYDYVSAETEPKDAYLSKISYTLTNSEGVAQLDNLKISYGREILPIKEQSITLDAGDNYTFPETMNVEMDDGSFRSFPAAWECIGDNELDTNTVGAYFYQVSLPYYNGVIPYYIYVKDRAIAEIPIAYASAFKGSIYKLPDTVMAVMDDGAEKHVSVIWQSEADTSETGTFEYLGNVEGYGEVKLLLSVVAPSVKNADDIYEGIALGGEYSLPSRVEVTFDDFSRGWVAVTWDGGESRVDTNRLGKYEYTGTVEGFSKDIRLTVTVYEDDPDLAYYLDCVQEFYDNCLTVARDRSQWFPEEYAAGYDPATPDKISDNPHSPLFSMGVSRETGTHSMWPAPSGDYPVEATATYGPLMKGLIGMTMLKRQHEYTDNAEMTAEEQEAEAEKYLEAVEESYDYILDHYVATESQMLKWGDHISRRFDTAHFEGFAYTDNNSHKTHQIENDYPEWDVMFRMNPEVTQRYIKSLWGAHFADGGKFGAALDKLYFSRHASVDNPYTLNEIDSVFEYRPEEDPTTHVHDKTSQLSYIIAATDFAVAAVELYQNMDDDGALWWGRKLLEMYHLAANPDTGIVPFQFTSTNGGNFPIKDVWYPSFDSFMPTGRAEHAFPDYADNPWCMDSGTMLQGKCGGGNLAMPLVCFAVADEVGGEVGAELEQWGISALSGFVNYVYNYRTGYGKQGLTDGTNLTDVKIKYNTYYDAAGKTTWPITVTTEMAWVLLDGYSRCHDEMFWECLRSIFMSQGLGDIGTAPGENVEIFDCITSADSDMLLAASRLYELTGEREYYKLAKKLAKNIVSNNFINGWFYHNSNGKHSRVSDPQPYAVLYFVAAAEGRSGMLPKYLGITQDFQLSYKYNDTKTASVYGHSLLNQVLDGSGGVTSVETNIKEAKLSVGERLEIAAEALPENADNLTLDWYSDNKKCCVVDGNGVVTALSPGKAVITAEAASGVYSDVTVYVE